ncbi:ATP-binding protein [Desulfobacterales bacterium HSG16]|nr:ATP-binding protein [Desulfobacterales bacterium HSG16]
MVFSLYFVVTVTVTLTQMSAEYLRQKESVEKGLVVIQHTFDGVLASALWKLDNDQVNSAIMGVLKFPSIIGMKISNQHGEIMAQSGVVTDGGGNQVRVGTSGATGSGGRVTGMFWHSFPLEYVFLGNTETQGEATVYSSSEVVFERVQMGFAFIIVNSVIKTVAIWFLFLWAFRRILGRPLMTLSDSIERLNLESLENQPGDGQDLDLKTTGNNELMVLEVTFNNMTRRMRDAVASLKELQEAAVLQRNQFYTTLRSIGDAVITTDKKGYVTFINPVAQTLTGWNLEEAVGRPLMDIFSIIDEETRQAVENPAAKAIWTDSVVGSANQTILISKDKKEIPIDNSSAPIRDEKGGITGIVLVFRDNTERKQAEEEKETLGKRLGQAQKMEAIGTLAGGIAHDFNNMLGVITGNISYALSNLKKNDELYEVLCDVQESSNQAQSLTHQLLTFSKGGAPIKKVSDVNSLIRESAIFSTRGASSNCSFELSDDLWATEVDEGQINQVIGNLVINANQAMPNGGIITIRTENTEIEDKSGLPLSAGRYLKIVAEDQGVGISKKHLSNIFDPYFTTKQKGSGLGLATTYSIIKKHSGHITVYSEIEKGTVFNIYLPASSQVFKETPEKEEITHDGQGKILIMDDQEFILKMVGRILNRMGYETVFATDGSQAVEMYIEAQSSGNKFNLVILDLTVPGGMGGLKTIIELLKIDPDVKAVVSSGYSNDPIMANYEDYGFFGVAPKPYTKAELSKVLNKIFGKNG